MNILFAYDIRKNINEFVSIHMRALANLGMNVVASRNEFWHPGSSYDIVIINWPDYLFSWRTDIQDEEVALLKQVLENYKTQNVKIFSFFHDEYSHFGRGVNLNLLFNLCYSHSDILIHLGAYSRDKYEKIYPNAEHYIINHPLFEEFNTEIDTLHSRKMLGIKKSDKLFIVPGSIRHPQEIQYVRKIFKNTKVRNKKLFFLRTTHLQKPKQIKSFKDIKSNIYCLVALTKYRYLDNIMFLRGFMDVDEVSKFFAASDVVIIPRIDILNSGNIILAAQFGKHIIGAGTGNMSELLHFLGQKIVSPDEVEKEDFTSFINTRFNAGDMQERIKLFAGNERINEQWWRILRKYHK